MDFIPKGTHKDIQNKLHTARTSIQHPFSDKDQIYKNLKIKGQFLIQKDDIEIRYGKEIFYWKKDIKELIDKLIEIIDRNTQNSFLETIKDSYDF